ncbi:MAG: hypothetical protein M0R18_11540 [Deltaproteobacteria bacterium]|jgi:hypothetical protein|nr:hypothetical protein [Deltaproteobacteria bacterium]MCK9502425.1 hypothetical protein [Lascolabacillus sp.]
MEVGWQVNNPNTPDYGTGTVVKVDNTYVTVYYSKIDEDRDYLVDNNPLIIVGTSTPMVEGRLGTENLDGRVKRDDENARQAQLSASEYLALAFPPRRADIAAIKHTPFHAMAEVETKIQRRNGAIEKKKQLLYANEHIRANMPLPASSGVNILAWTHPAIQLSLIGDLRVEDDIRAYGYTLRSVKPLARSRFFTLFPISGLYEPGGLVGIKEKVKPAVGLKAVKLDMTPEQVRAFLSKMSGMMLVSGAPGSGKTTVAIQRIRFLFDQQELRVNLDGNIRYSTELTKIFLANENLISYSKEMLEKGMQIPSSVVEAVDAFTVRYLNDIWAFKHNARIRTKKIFPLEERARMAFFGLCSVRELQDCWQRYEEQIAERFKDARQAPWLEIPKGENTRTKAQKLAYAFKVLSASSISRHPLQSNLSMDMVYGKIGKEYESLREVIRGEGDLEKFDAEFQKWLFWVYDPLDAIISYFSEEMYQGGVRIKKGTAGKIDENTVLESLREDWKNRTYGPEELPWLAFLLRFVLPSVTDHRSRFREMPNPLEIAGVGDGARWTHVMVDEAQDLCVAQAALLGSFVHPDGAFTVSADFNQIVSPVWGMENPDAFKIGISLRDKGVFQSFPFAKNMRQSRQIGVFLQSFHKSVFGKLATFEVNEAVEGPKPILFVGNSSEFTARILQRLNVLHRNPDIKSVALLQVNEDEVAMNQIRANLETRGAELAPIWAASDSAGRLVTTSVERIKGLEYDACFVIGMDDDENMSLNFAKNRAYVALSRPALHLAIFCNEIPRALQKIDSGLMDIIYN